jgi:hypothetical protein
VNYFAPYQDHWHAEQYFRYVRDFCVWGTVAVTVLSGLAYVRRAMVVFAKHSQPVLAMPADED